jgi:hypothetical protein
VVHTLAFDSRGRLFVGDRQNNRIQIFDQNGKFIAQWFQFGRPSNIYIDKNDVIYVADSVSRDGRTNTGQFGLPQTGYGFNLGAQRGIRIGSAKDGSVKYFIPDPCPYPYPAGSSLGRHCGFRRQRVRGGFSRRCQKIRKEVIAKRLLVVGKHSVHGPDRISTIPPAGGSSPDILGIAHVQESHEQLVDQVDRASTQ